MNKPEPPAPTPVAPDDQETQTAPPPAADAQANGPSHAAAGNAFPRNIVVIGSGGRESALVWRLGQDVGPEHVWGLPGHPAMPQTAAIAPDDVEAIASFCRAHHIDLVVIGPEKPLAAGLVDALRERGIPTVGPTKAAARLETSKAFAKDFMRRHGVATAAFRPARTLSEAAVALQAFDWRGVLKVDGLAAGKGVWVVRSEDEAKTALAEAAQRFGPGTHDQQQNLSGNSGDSGDSGSFSDSNSSGDLDRMDSSNSAHSSSGSRRNGHSGPSGTHSPPPNDHPTRAANFSSAAASSPTAWIVEELLEGVEISLIGLVAGEQFQAFPPAQDHKTLLDGDQGPNTGGMGAYCPVPFLSAADRQAIAERVIRPTLAGLRADRLDYRGFLYCGLMMTADGPKVLEYNVRLGDPETQVLLPAVTSCLATALWHVAHGEPCPALTASDRFWVGVVLASEGYPLRSSARALISGLDRVAPDALVFHAGTEKAGHDWWAVGGRVLTVVASGATLTEARHHAYAACSQITFPGRQFRTDIADRPEVRLGLLQQRPGKRGRDL